MVLTHRDLLRKGVLPSFCFSFEQSTLEAEIKTRNSFRDYDTRKPSTYPLVTLDKLNRHIKKHRITDLEHEYTGRQDLPRYVAYETAIIEKFLAKHAFKDMARGADTLHDRFPFNFTIQDFMKKEIGMTTHEEAVYKQNKGLGAQASAKRVNDTPAHPDNGRAEPVPKASSCQSAACAAEKKRASELHALVAIKDAESARLSAEIKHLKRKWARVDDYESDEQATKRMSSQERHARHG